MRIGWLIISAELLHKCKSNQHKKTEVPISQKDLEAVLVLTSFLRLFQGNMVMIAAFGSVIKVNEMYFVDDTC